MTAQEKFQQSVKDALKLHGQNKWGNRHSEYVIASMIADEVGQTVEELLALEGFKLAAKTINPSAFAQWMENHVKGFERETKGKKAESLVKGFTLDSE